jgi:hypothetical protein
MTYSLAHGCLFIGYRGALSLIQDIMHDTRILFMETMHYKLLTVRAGIPAGGCCCNQAL